MTNTEKRKGNWMQTATGRAFWPLDPQPEDVAIADIAHALAHICRYNGHCSRFYSVAEHSVLVASALPPQLKLCGLLHDAAEAYVGDMTRPLKPHMPTHQDAEFKVHAAIARRYRLTLPMPDEVWKADFRILIDEQDALMPNPPFPWEGLAGHEPLGVTIEGWPPDLAKERFLSLFRELYVAAA